MRMPIAQTIAALAGAATLAAGGAAYAASGHHATPSHTAKAKATATVAEPTSPDTDTLQSGDQTTPDTTAGGGAQTGESGSGSEQAGNDGPGGHADEPGNPNADHQFQGQE
jgi:hypothetical protein